jgi:hypothetical protein
MGSQARTRLIGLTKPKFPAKVNPKDPANKYLVINGCSSHQRFISSDISIAQERFSKKKKFCLNQWKIAQKNQRMMSKLMNIL